MSSHRERMIPHNTAQASRLVTVAGQDFTWIPGQGLDPSAVLAVEGMILTLARRMLGSAQGVGLSLEDLAQEGRLEALKSCRTYDPDRGAFTTHAYRWVRGGILNALQHAHPLGLSEDAYHSLLKAGQLPEVCSLQAPAAGSDRTVEDALAAASTELGEVEQLVHVALRRLSPQDQEALMRRYGLAGEEESVEELAGRWRVTPRRARQIHAQALRRLRAVLRALNVPVPEEHP